MIGGKIIRHVLARAAHVCLVALAIMVLAALARLVWEGVLG